jgi:hypothetical protein
MATKFKIGDRVTVTGNSNSHNYPIGSRVTLMYEQYLHTPQAAFRGKIEKTGFVGNWLAIADIKLQANTLSDLEEEAAGFKDRLAAIEAKISFLKDNGLEVYDEKLFKIHNALSLIETTDSKLEKAKRLAELFKDLK